MPDNQVEYRTVTLGSRVGTLGEHDSTEDRRTRIEGADAVLGQPLNLDALGRHERGDGLLQDRRVDLRQHDAPLGSLEPIGESRGADLDDLDHIETRGQGLVKSLPESLGVAAFDDRDLEVLRLAGRAGGGGACVRHLRVRAEPGAERDRDPGPTHGALERPLKVTVAGEAQPPTLGVANAKTLNGQGRRRTIRGTRHLRRPHARATSRPR